MQLEKDIENAIVWSKENRLNFNFDKFKNVQFSLRKNQNKQILRLPSHRNIPQEIHFKDLGIYFPENLSWDYHLSFVLRKANQKLAYLKRSIPSETKLSIKCNLVKTYIISILFYGSNVWFASKTIVRQMERLQRKSLKWKQSNSHFTDKEYNDCLRSVNLLPITYQIVFLNLVVLNRILTRKLPLEAEQFWQYCKYSNECNRQRCRSNFFQRVTNFNNSMSLARDFPNYNPYSGSHKFKKEVKEYLFDLAKKNFNYKLYPYGWTVFEGNQIQAPLGTY